MPTNLPQPGRGTFPLVYAKVALAISLQTYFLCSSLLDWPEDPPVYWLIFAHV